MEITSNTDFKAKPFRHDGPLLPTALALSCIIVFYNCIIVIIIVFSNVIEGTVSSIDDSCSLA